MRRPVYYFVFLILLSVSGFSCDRMKNRGKKLVADTKQELSDRKERLSDQLTHPFHSDIPDSKSNKRRFREFFGFEPDSAVRSIYAFGDGLGIDSKYQFSFHCDTVTRNRIVNHLGLEKDGKPDHFGQNLMMDFPWWDSSFVRTSIPYKRKGEHELYEFLWYKEADSTVYYFTFDM